MSHQVVLVADPIGGDVSAIAVVLASHGLSTITPKPHEGWQDMAGAADGLIVNLAVVNSTVLDRLVKCRVIARLGVGVNNIDVASARQRSIVVTNVPDYCREEVSDHALALMLSMVRKLNEANRDVQRGLWRQLGCRPIRRLKSLTLGLLGFGKLAQALARKASALGMRVIAHDPLIAQDPSGVVELTSLDSLLASADVLSLHAPLLPETNGLIGTAAFRKMKPGAILINTSRGEVVDVPSLIAALDEGRLSGAALDVLEIEPLPADSQLRGRSNVMITPHMAFYSEDSLIDLQRTAAEDVVRVLSGDAPRYSVHSE